ncbi:toll/interleukin-1 receptor domain-containing protein [Capnocytophaga gingivalis]|uniref:toll/interleukin-1 receptor domain-containing protein n=1 Tax=Capnocytophaga gingivalis TaxID=1017 RepID=UPI0028D44CD5|nr:toll/interleukin-1 receptor domain-containing protein [Capnocytophaga gingivalis]
MNFVKVFFDIKNLLNYKKMYRGFNLEIDRKYLSLIKSNRPLSLKEQLKYQTEKLRKPSGLDFFSVLNEGTLDGNKIIEKWFPNNIKYDIFLSHSHKDRKLALKIADVLEKEHNLKVFVDSNIWGNSIDLLKEIDDEYCMVKEQDLYYYQKCVYSSSQVFLMLMNSLNIMIDRCEALFFLNTPNSISLKQALSREAILEKTNSAWIFSELQTSEIIRKETPRRLLRKTKLFSANEEFIPLNESNNQLRIEYEAKLAHLTNISLEDFIYWISLRSYGNSEKALDNLYQMYPLDRNIHIDFS